MNKGVIIYWIPLLIGLGFLVLGVFLPRYVSETPSWVGAAAITLATLLIVLAGVLVHWQKSNGPSQGGRGGNAQSYGDDNEVIGGRGGDAGRGDGGDGGKAIAKGRRSVARGGDGGKGG